MASQPESLIKVLLNRSAPMLDRDDAASFLGRFSEPEAEAALVEVASDPLSDPELADSCGEALAVVWLRREELREHVLARLTWPALHVLVPTLLAKRRDWAPLVKHALRGRSDVDWNDLAVTVGPWFTKE
jgi:hypothetical protein